MGTINTEDSLQASQFLEPDISGPGSLKDVTSPEESDSEMMGVLFHRQSPLHPVDSEYALRLKDMFGES